ncbi:hypothetical protein JCM8547_002214 [Rhodosporidiobolus lusitaniae]
MSRYFVDFASGDQAAYSTALAVYEALAAWLAQKGPQYGLSSFDELDEAGRETLSAVYEGDTKISLTPSSFSPPPSLLLPRLYLTLSSSPGLKKTTANFHALITNEKQLKSKSKKQEELKYEGCKVFRVEKEFVAQMGDVTRQDGSGGESIYGGTFSDEKEGLKIPFELGTVAMANSGKNSNTSQFFLTLTSSPDKLKKLTGKYVAFGQVDLSDVGSKECLARLDGLGDGKGGTREPVWIEKCGIVV